MCGSVPWSRCSLRLRLRRLLVLLPKVGALHVANAAGFAFRPQQGAERAGCAVGWGNKARGGPALSIAPRPFLPHTPRAARCPHCRCLAVQRFSPWVSWHGEERPKPRGVPAGSPRDGSSEPAGMEPLKAPPLSLTHCSPPAGAAPQIELCCWMGRRAALQLPGCLTVLSDPPSPPSRTPFSTRSLFLLSLISIASQ